MLNIRLFIVEESAKIVRRTLNANTVAECPATPEQWDHLINKSLSGSDFDLMIHDEDNREANDVIYDKRKDPNTPTSV